MVANKHKKYEESIKIVSAISASPSASYPATALENTHHNTINEHSATPLFRTDSGDDSALIAQKLPEIVEIIHVIVKALSNDEIDINLLKKDLTSLLPQTINTHGFFSAKDHYDYLFKELNEALVDSNKTNLSS